MKSIELFAGAGGLGIGISNAGFRPELVVEWDKWCCDTIRENRAARVAPLKHWPKPTHGDVRDIDYKNVQGPVALVSGGPPCQPFSIGGRHGAYMDSRDMWPEAIRAVRETAPKAFIFENVKGLTRATFASYLSYIEKHLSFPEITRRHGEEWTDHLSRLEQHYNSKKRGTAGLQYRVIYRVLNAANFGIPQKRERVVFVGFREGLHAEWSFPDESHSLEALAWDQVKGDYWDRHKVTRAERAVSVKWECLVDRLESRPHTAPWKTVRDALYGLPDPELHPRLASQFHNHRFQPGARAYVGHTGSPLDEPAKTLKAGVHGVPGGENMLLRPDGSVRYFSVRESARLQTFPDEFKFHGAWSEAMRQLGNAVPVTLATAIAESVKKHLKTAGMN